MGMVVQPIDITEFEKLFSDEGKPNTLICENCGQVFGSFLDRRSLIKLPTRCIVCGGSVKWVFIEPERADAYWRGQLPELIAESQKAKVISVLMSVKKNTAEYCQRRISQIRKMPSE